MRKNKVLFILTALLCTYLIYKVSIRGYFYPFMFEVSKVSYNISTFDQETTLIPTLSYITNNDCIQGELMYGNFCVISPYNYESFESSSALVTLSTQGTIEFLHHVNVLCSRWSGPISVAVYSLPCDYLKARQLVDKLRYCNFCIRHWVSWHFFFYKSPIADYSKVDNFQDCQTLIMESKSEKNSSQGIYPINVGRNIARSKTTTSFVFPIDIELYPSSGVLPKFERMIRTVDLTEGRHVWVLPVFEVLSKYNAPMTKRELTAMYMKKQAISFHKYRCNMCHKIPNLDKWLNNETYSQVSLKPEVNESLEPLRIWATVKRSKKYRLHVWEPFFIGTKNDPEFDIRLSWEGKQNKMQLAFEMCLMDYNFHIVENAFLVHAPGINVYNASKDKFRQKHVIKNNKIISQIRKNLFKKYGSNNNC